MGRSPKEMLWSPRKSEKLDTTGMSSPKEGQPSRKMIIVYHPTEPARSNILHLMGIHPTQHFGVVMIESQTASHASWLKTQQRFRIFRKTCRAGSLVLASTLPKMMKKTHSWLCWLPFSVQNHKEKKKADWDTILYYIIIYCIILYYSILYP